MHQRVRTGLRRLAILAVAGALAGVAYMPFVADAVSFTSAGLFAAQGMLITTLVFGFEFFVARGAASEKLRRARFAVALAARSLATTLLILLAFAIGGLLLFPDRFSADQPIRDLARDTAYSLAVAVALQFVLMVRDIVGGRVLVNLILGRYHRPLTEQRIFMFLDVSGSTALAETMGALGAYRMISRFFFDVAQETARFGGETHEYIGDEVVVTWPLGGARDNARCIDCYFAICDRIAARAAAYRREFGRVPQFCAGLHGGPVVAGECGDDKREIVYFGDTINTAARIVEACKERDLPLLVSGDLSRGIALPPACVATSLGSVPLRGRAREIELVRIARDAGCGTATARESAASR
jgi:class 3 adenylate cyclase